MLSIPSNTDSYVRAEHSGPPTAGIADIGEHRFSEGGYGGVLHGTGECFLLVCFVPGRIPTGVIPRSNPGGMIVSKHTSLTSFSEEGPPRPLFRRGPEQTPNTVTIEPKVDSRCAGRC